MQTHIARWGNSLALRIPRPIAARLRLDAGGAVELSVEDDRLVVRSSRRPLRLDDLLAGITPANLPASADDGARGEEALQVAAPDRGDLVWLAFAPQGGPRVGRRWCCRPGPITSARPTPWSARSPAA